MDLTTRVSQLETRVKNLEKELQIRPETTTYETYETHSNHENNTPTFIDHFIQWCKNDWLMKLGALLLLLALGWFVTYAFANNWIGPIGRITIGTIVGAIIMQIGNTLIPKKPVPGQTLAVLGGVMILTTIFAARSFYDFFTPASALLIMSIVIVGMAIIGVFHNARSVAILALLGGAAAPILVDAPTTNELALLSYVFLLNLGTIIVASLRGWRSMNLIALIITAIYSLASFGSLPNLQLWIFMGIFFSLFFLTNFLAALRTRQTHSVDLITAGINGVLLLYWVKEYIPNESASLVLSGVIILIMITTYIFNRINELKSKIYLDCALALILLASATAFELKGAVLITAFFIEALLSVILATYALKDTKLAHYFSTTQLIPIAMTLPLILDASFSTALFNNPFIPIFIGIVSLTATAIILHRNPSKDLEIPITTAHGVLAGLFTIALIWISSHRILEHHNTAITTALVIYTLSGITALFFAAKKQSKSLNIAGSIILGGVVLRLLIVDLWSMSIEGKVITFVAIGALLVSTAFFQKHINNSTEK